MSSRHLNLERREWLRRAGSLSRAGVAAPFALILAAMAEAAAQTVADYDALVCVFLYGGNDYGNTLVPYDSASHAAYAVIRGSLATPRDTLTATALNPSVALRGGRGRAPCRERVYRGV